MKTTKLMTAFALSAVFAACSQDADLNEAIVKNDFSDVPMVEANFTANFGAESRMATQYELELNDIVGFAWLGKIGTGEAWANYPLYCTDADAKAFEGTSMYYVGNYFAYMPYSETTADVAYIPFSIKGQTLTENLNDCAKYAMQLSVKPIVLSTEKDADNKAGRGQNIALKLSELSNTAKIELAFANAEEIADLKVSEVVVTLKNGSNALALPMSFGYKPYSGNKTKWTEVPTSEFWVNNADNTVYGELTLSNKEGLEISNGEASVYAVMLPANTVDLKNAKLSVKVTTNYGTITSTSVKIKDAGATEYKALSETTPLFSQFGKNGTIKAELDMEKAVFNNMTVYSQAELDDVLNKLVAINEKSKTTIKLGKEAKPAAAFTLTDFILPEDLNCEVNLVAGSNINSVEFAGNTTINKPIIVNLPSVVTGNMTVNYIKDATTFNHAGVTVSHDATLTNKGVISGNIKTVKADSKKALGFGKFIIDGEKAEIINGSKVENLGEAQWINGKVPAVTEGTNNVYAEVTSIAQVEKANEKSIKTVRLMDSWLYNNGDDFSFANIEQIECYGNSGIYVTLSNNGQPRHIYFTKLTTMTVKNGYMNIQVEDKNATLNIGKTISVEEGATLNITDITNAITINNEGWVNLNNTPNIKKGTGKGTWIENL